MSTTDSTPTGNIDVPGSTPVTGDAAVTGDHTAAGDAAVPGEAVSPEASPFKGTKDESMASKVARKKRVIAMVTAGVVVVAGAVIVPLQIQAAEHQDAWEAYTAAVKSHDSAVDDFEDAAATLTDRYVLAADEADMFTSVIAMTPDEAVDPLTAKQEFVDAVAAFQSTAGITVTAEDATVPAIYTVPLETVHAQMLPQDTTAEKLRAQTKALTRGTASYSEETESDNGIVKGIDTAYDETVVKLDAMMLAARTWGARDIYEKDTAEQTAAMIASAEALVKPEGEQFASLEERVTAMETFTSAAAAAKAGHEQTLAAEAEAARQAAEAEAARQAAAQRQQSSSGNRGTSSGTRSTSTGTSNVSPGGMGAPRNYGDCGCLGDKNVWQ